MKPGTTFSEVPADAPEPALLERHQTLARMADVIGAAPAGRGAALFLVGDAGTGKTALLHEARRTAPVEMCVLQASGSSMEREVPFALIERVVGPLVVHGGGAAGPDPWGRRSALYELARSRLHELSSSAPLVVLLDDLQWADRDSLGVLSYVVRRLAHGPVSVIGTLRPWPDEVLTTFSTLADGGDTGLVRVEPLSPASSVELLNELVGPDLDEELVERTWALAKGNPLLVREAARNIMTEGSLPELGADDPSQLRSSLLLSHLAGLPSLATACAQAASVLGDRFSLAVVHNVAALDDPTFVEAFDALVVAGILRVGDAGQVEFHHDLLCVAIYNDMPPARRRLLHTRAFFSLVNRSETAAAIPHALAADLIGDERAIAAVTDAAIQALDDGAIEAGLVQIDAAVTLAGPLPPDDLLLRQADARLAVGRATEALAIYQRLLGRSLPPGKRAATMAKAARAQAFAGHLDAALATYDELLAHHDLGAEQLPTVLERTHVVWELGGPAAALPALDAELARLQPGEDASSGDPGASGAGDSRDTPAMETVRVVRNFFRLEMGDPSGLADIERMSMAVQQRVADSPDEVVGTFHAVSLHVNACAIAEQFDLANELIDLGTGLLRAQGALRSTIPFRVARLGILLIQGSLFDVLSEADDIQQELNVDPLELPHVLLFRAQALTWLGRTAEAEAVCTTVEAMQAVQSWYASLNLGVARGHRLFMDGQLDQAADCFQTVAEQAVRFGSNEAFSPPWAGRAIEAALAAGRTDQASAVVTWLRQQGGSHTTVWPRLVELAGAAGCAAADGDDGRADALYREAIELPAVSPLDRAQILLRYGGWLRRQSRDLAARPVLAEAAQVGEERGATILAARAIDELSAAGGRRRRARTATALTAQEVRVADLAASGATTREIASEFQLSPRTVETHLAHVFQKLEIDSRRQLRQQRHRFRQD